MFDGEDGFIKAPAAGADRRLERIGLPRQYMDKNPFPWMSETIDLGKEKNFFESRVTDYQKGSTLTWE